MTQRDTRIMSGDALFAQKRLWLLKHTRGAIEVVLVPCRRATIRRRDVRARGTTRPPQKRRMYTRTSKAGRTLQ